MLKEGGDELVKAIHNLFHKSWEIGSVPADWKIAAVKFVKKPGKKSYHQASSYRPISLTSSMGKCLERIIVTRLNAFAEHKKLFDEEQEGFRKYRGTTLALLRLTQDIFKGFNKNKHTMAIFIDMEKAYDTVWRERLMVKLARMGINGNMWKWLNSFMKGRKAKCTLKKFDGEMFETIMGLPQGSVLSPVLFNLFIADMLKSVLANKVKFADDATIWKTGDDIREIAAELELDLNKIKQWVHKWRMKINVSKTEYCIFSRILHVDSMEDIEISIGGQKIKQNQNPKLLGVILDRKLNFQEHIKYVEAKAQMAVASLNKVAKTEHIGTKCLLTLYQSLVTPRLEYAAAVWQTGNCESLEKVQRQGLALCLGLPKTSGVEALEVEAGILPLSLRREELAIREMGKIMAKDDTQKIKSTFEDWRENAGREKFISPFGKMFMQMNDMQANTGVTFHSLEPEPSFKECMQPTIQRPDYWNNLGSSKSRTAAQEEKAKELIEQIVEDSPQDTVFAFTDGSCRGNPGPCGAGAGVFFPGQEEHVSLKQPVSKLASILLGELVAILITLTFLKKRTRKERHLQGKIIIRLSICCRNIDPRMGSSDIQTDNTEYKGTNRVLQDKGHRYSNRLDAWACQHTWE